MKQKLTITLPNALEYNSKDKRQFNLRIDVQSIEYIEDIASKNGISSTMLINAILRNAITSGMTIK